MLLFALLALCVGLASSQNTTLISYSAASWRYYDLGAIATPGWAAAAFGDGSWKVGVAPMGYGTPLAKTAVASTSVTTYYRIAFNHGATPAGDSFVALLVNVWDGAVVYLNGVEIGRFNMPSVTVLPTTVATTQVSQATAPSFTLQMKLETKTLVLGRNVLAVEVHRAAKTPPQSLLAVTMTLVAIPTPTATATLTLSRSVTASRPPSPSFTPIPTGQFIGFKSVWQYSDDGSDLGLPWRTSAFDDKAWKSGRGILGTCLETLVS